MKYEVRDMNVDTWATRPSHHQYAWVVWNTETSEVTYWARSHRDAKWAANWMNGQPTSES